MKRPLLAVTLALIATLAVSRAETAAGCACSPEAKLVALADAPAAGKLLPSSVKDAAWLAKARAAYPLKTCVVSGDELGSMGKSPEYIYRVEGKEDRLVVFCCDGCEEDFMKNPEGLLAKIASGKAAPDAKSESGHGAHSKH